MRVSPILAAAISSLLLFDAQAKAPNYTGTWVYSIAPGRGGTLLIVDTGAKQTFQLELFNGPPAFNQGFLQGEITLVNRQAAYVHPEIPDCRITFRFNAKSVVVSDSYSFCGFGWQVYVNGTFKRISDRPAAIYKCWPSPNENC